MSLIYLGSMITQPDDKHINFQDYKDTDPEYCRQFKVNRTPSRERMWNNGKGRMDHVQTLTNAEGTLYNQESKDRCPNSGLVEFDDFCRYLTRREIEQAQTLPWVYRYTDIWSDARTFVATAGQLTLSLIFKSLA